MPEGDVLESDDGRQANDAGEPAEPLRDDGVALVRHRRRSLLPAAERLLDLANLRPGEMPDLERKRLERRCDDGQRRKQLGVTIALEDLGRRRCGLQAEPLAREALDLRVGRGVRADRAGELADAHALQSALDTSSIAIELERPARQLETERGRLACTVRASDQQRVPVLLGPANDGGRRPVDPLEDQRTCLEDLERQGGVEHI